MKKLLVFGILFLTVFHVKGQHSPLFSQYMFNGLVINPAYAMERDGLNATLYYKKQWAGFNGAPSTLSGSLQSAMKGEKYNIGLIYLQDQYGLQSQNNISGSFAYRINTGSGKLGLGISGGMSVLYFNRNRLKLVDQNDPTFSNISTYRILPKIGLGMYYHTDKFFFGVSFPQWLISNSHQNVIIPGILSHTLMLYTGYHFDINPDLVITPSLLFKVIAGSSPQTDFNVLGWFKKTIGVGVSYRTYNNMVFLLQFKMNKFAFGYAYDLSNKNLTNYTSGSQEFMIRYKLDYGVNAPSPKTF